MVCTCPAARSLSKARSEGAVRENIAQADISASAQAISVSPTRESGRRAKALCTKRKSASADRYCRPCGATMDRTPPDIWTSDHICTGEFSHSPLRKGNENIEVVIGFAHPPGIVAKAVTFYNFKYYNREPYR